MTARMLSGFVITIASSMTCNHVAALSADTSAVVQRPAIVLVAFGTSVPKARKVFDYVEAAARKRYPEHDVRWAFTSQFVVKKLRRQGVEVKSLGEVIADLKSDGHTSAVFQSLHVVPGQGYHDIRKVDTSGLRITVGSALLADDHDIGAVAKALEDEIKASIPNVIVCHGNQHHRKFNRQLVAFAERVEAKHANVVVCSIDGQPGTDKLAKARGEAVSSGKVHFIPLMVVAGVHVTEDVLSDKTDSWKSIIGAKETTCAKPLGYRDKVLAVYFRHLDKALSTLNQQAASESKP